MKIIRPQYARRLIRQGKARMITATKAPAEGLGRYWITLERETRTDLFLGTTADASAISLRDLRDRERATNV